MSDSQPNEGDSSEASDQHHPKTPWALAAVVIKTLGDRAGVILTAAAVIFAIYMFIEQSQLHRKQEQQSVQTATEAAQKKLEAAQKKLDNSSVRLTETYDLLLQQHRQQVDDISKFMKVRDEVAKSVLDQQEKLRTAQEDVDKEREKLTVATDSLNSKQNELATAQTAITEVGKKLKEISDKLASTEVSLRDSQSAIRNVKAWAHLFRLANLAGQIVGTRNPDTARSVHDKMIEIDVDKIAEGELEQPDASLQQANRKLRTAISALGQSLTRWPIDKEAPKVVRNAALEVATMCRERITNTAPDLLRPVISELERVLYDEAVAVTKRLAEKPDWAQASEDRREFWSLYYGRLVSVESQEVETAMVRIGTALDEWRKEKDATKERLSQLAQNRRALAAELIRATKSIATLAERGTPTIKAPTRSPDVVRKRVIEIVKYELVTDKVTESTSLESDLGADLLDIVELLMSIEEEFSVQIPDDVAERLQTVGDVVNYVTGEMKK